MNTSHIQIATAGEALFDLVTQPSGQLLPCAGGSVYNLTRALGRQSQAVGYLNPFSSDRFGRQLHNQLLADGVIVLHGEPVNEPTSLAVVAVNDNGHPDYAFYRSNVADRAVSSQGLIDQCTALPNLSTIVTGCLALSPDDQEKYLPWLAESKKSGLTVVVDANLRPAVLADAAAYRRNVHAALAYADIIKASDEDLAFLFDSPAPAEQLARQLLTTTSATIVALTLGAAGAAILHRDGRHWHAIDTAPIAIQDTVGAGDCFLAGLLTKTLTNVKINGSDPFYFDALKFGVACAGFCVSRVGCDPPTAEQAADWVKRGTIRVT